MGQGLPGWRAPRRSSHLRLPAGALLAGARPRRAGDVSSAGLVAADHPLLGAAVELAQGQGALLTGRLSLETHPWLADHVVAGRVVVPGTALLELALRAGAQTDCPTVQEITFEAPLTLPERGGVDLQLSVGARDDAG
ncbi:hypothetical protein ACFQVA_41090 [Actinomadura keratinilytica]